MNLGLRERVLLKVDRRQLRGVALVFAIWLMGYAHGRAGLTGAIEFCRKTHAGPSVT